MDEYRIRLDHFEGPLDLLLHLVRKNEYDIFDIPMAQITSQYLAFLDMMRQLDIEVAGEYLVMSATLARIKSALLLPRPESEDGDEGPDPREELARQLLEYARYREAAADFAQRPILGRDVFARKFPSPELDNARRDATYLEVDVFELIEAFRQVLKRVPIDQRVHMVRPDRFSIRERMSQITVLLGERPSMMFDQLFDPGTTKSEMITTFLAVLELMKMRLVRIFQQERLGPIHIMAQVVGRDAEVTANAAPALGYAGDEPEHQNGSANGANVKDHQTPEGGEPHDG